MLVLRLDRDRWFSRCLKKHQKDVSKKSQNGDYNLNVLSQCWFSCLATPEIQLSVVTFIVVLLVGDMLFKRLLLAIPILLTILIYLFNKVYSFKRKLT